MRADGSSPGAFELYAHLRAAPAAETSPLLDEALVELRRHLGGKPLRRKDLSTLPGGSLAHRFAEVALSYVAFEDELRRPLPVAYQGPQELLRWIDNLYQVQDRARAADPVLRARDLSDPDFVARVAVLCISHTAWNVSPGRRGDGPTTIDCLAACDPELTRLAGLYARLQAAPRHERAHLTRQLAAAERDALRAAFCDRSSGADLEGALRRLDAPEAALFREQVDRAGPDVFEAPHQDRRLLATTKRSEVMAVSAVQALEAMSAPAPMLERTVALLEARGLLRHDTFAGVELWVHTHGLLSLARLLEILRTHGLETVNVQNKGVSTSPVVASALGRWCTDYGDGYGSGQMSPKELERQLAGGVTESARWAERRGAIFLGLGDGMEAARAFLRGVKGRDVPLGYVEFTTSGVNELRASAHPCDATCLGASALKHAVDNELLGPWLVDYDARLTAAEGGKPLEQSRPVVIGGGPVGASVARALWDRGCRPVVVVEPNAERAAKLPPGITVVSRPLHEAMVAGDVYYSCVGLQGVWTEPMMRALPPGARLCNFASRGEIDPQLLHRAIQHRLPGCKTRLSRRDASLPDHRVLSLDFGRGAVQIRHLGLPLFDAKTDKDAKLADVYMSGLLACLCEQLQRIREGRPAEVRPLRQDLQDALLELQRAIYPDASAR